MDQPNGHSEVLAKGYVDRVEIACRDEIIAIHPRSYETEDMRHADHRFEWSRAEFLAWVKNIAAIHGYEFKIKGIGEPDEELGTPTQMAVFTCL